MGSLSYKSKVKIFEQAFQKIIKTTEISADVCNHELQLVSLCLDVYEIMFNKEYHKLRNEEVYVKRVSIQDMEVFQYDYPELQELGSTCFEELKISHYDLLFIKKDSQECLLAISSPYTGFVPSNHLLEILDSKKSEIPYVGIPIGTISPIKRYNTLGYLFTDIVPFHKRNIVFQEYILKLFEDCNDNKYQSFCDFIASFNVNNNIRTIDLNLLEFLTDSDTTIFVNGLSLKYNSFITNNLFLDYLIKIPFRISNEFSVAESLKTRTTDYLLPLTDAVLLCIDFETFKYEFKEYSRQVVFSMWINGQKYTKKYAYNGLSNTGRILDLTLLGIEFDLGIFPSYKLAYDESIMYDIVLAYHNKDCIKLQFNCSFVRRKDCLVNEFLKETTSKISTDYAINKPIQRSVQKEISDSSTRLYKIKGTSFDAISIEFRTNNDESFCGIVIPRWNEYAYTGDEYIYAIDLNESYISIARCLKPVKKNTAEVLTMKYPIVKYLNDWNSSNVHPNIKQILCEEFYPYFINGVLDKFPIRTILSLAKENNVNSYLKSGNILFGPLNKEAYGNNLYLKGLIWDNTFIENFRCYIKELLSLIKCDVVQRGGDLSATDVVWLKPQRVGNYFLSTLERIWEQEYISLFGLSMHHIKSFPRADASYYYFLKESIISSQESVLLVNLDDKNLNISYYLEGEPSWINSVDSLITFLNDDRVENIKEIMIYYFIAIIYYIAIICKSKDSRKIDKIIFVGNGWGQVKVIDPRFYLNIVKKIFLEQFGQKYKCNMELVFPDLSIECASLGYLSIVRKKEVLKKYIFNGVNSVQYSTNEMLIQDFDISLKKSLVKYTEKCNLMFLDLENYGIYIPEKIIRNILNRKTIANEIVLAFDELKEKMGKYSTFKDTLFFLGIKRQLMSLINNN